MGNLNWFIPAHFFSGIQFKDVFLKLIQPIEAVALLQIALKMIFVIVWKEIEKLKN